MTSYDFLRQVELWLGGAAALLQLMCGLLTARDVETSETFRYLGAAFFLGAFTFGTHQVIQQGNPPGTRIFWLTGSLCLINAGLIVTLIKAIRKRWRTRSKKET